MAGRGSGSREKRRLWAGVAGLVRRRPRAIVAGVFAVLAVLALGNLIHHGTIGFGEGETRSTESSRGNEVLDEHFPPGIGSPLTAVMGIDEVDAALNGLERLTRSSSPCRCRPPRSPTWRRWRSCCAATPTRARQPTLVKGVRERLAEVAPGALVGGIPAENYDVEQTNARDTKLIVPVVLVVVGLILIMVLRALAAPGYLIVTVVASFAATLGLVTFAFTSSSARAGSASTWCCWRSSSWSRWGSTTTSS